MPEVMPDARRVLRWSLIFQQVDSGEARMTSITLPSRPGPSPISTFLDLPDHHSGGPTRFFHNATSPLSA